MLFFPPRIVEELEVSIPPLDARGDRARGVTCQIFIPQHNLENEYDVLRGMDFRRIAGMPCAAATVSRDILAIYTGGHLAQVDSSVYRRGLLLCMRGGQVEYFALSDGAQALSNAANGTVIGQADWFFMIPPYSTVEIIYDRPENSAFKLVAKILNYRGDFILFEKQSGYVRAAGTRESLTAYSLVCGADFSYRSVGHEFFERLYLNHAQDYSADFIVMEQERNFFERRAFRIEHLKMNIISSQAPPQVKAAKPRRLLSLTD